jgi:hypothetical protein
MTEFPGRFTVELVPHCASVRPARWTGDHDRRPPTELGHRHAAALTRAPGSGLDGIKSGPAPR